MSLIVEYRSTETAIKELQARLSELNNSDELQAEMAFEQELRDLLSRYNKSLKDVILILDPMSAKSSAGKSPVGAANRRAPRRVKRYTNPSNGEVVDTKGGNNRQITAWKAKHGAEEVESWSKYLD
ncbi:histone-like nucleoid-structuring protein, MvaT/MvaU family [Pseudomonas tritici]|uniref:histone-like nucleoid-structuring protein, MvaT/MvaU family n=1 Tax=Pseudomonas tritici TaxID=2745518 RepID=UPI00387A9655